MASYNSQIALQLQHYEVLGAKQGRQMLPPSNASTPDENEIRLEAEAKQFALNEHADFNQNVASINKEAADIEQRLVDARIRAETLLSDSGLANTINEHLEGEKAKLVHLKSNELELLSDLKGFKHEHKINRVAHYPSDLLLHMSWIVLFIAIETVVNAFFFENQNGLLGGAVVAFAISVVNIGIAGLMGYFFRYINHKIWWQSVFGWSCLALFFVATIYLNAVFSTFRYEYQLITDPSELKETTAAFGAALASAANVFYLKIPFNDILSFVLFFIGCLLGGYAFFKGFTFDDRYPGYGAIDRHHKDALRKYTDAESKARESIRSVLEKGKSELVGARTSLTTEGARITHLRRKLDVIKSESAATLERIQREFQLVSETYRKSNTSVRAIPAPTYFGATTDIRGNLNSDIAATATERIDGLGKEFGKIHEDYLEKLSNKIQEYSSHHVQTLGTIFNSFTTNIQLAAFQAIAASHQVLDRAESNES